MTSSTPSDQYQDFLARLEQELATASGQLDDYQRLIDQMPEIYEAKFTHQLHDVARDIRNLIEERKRLQQDINNCLLTGDELTSAQARPDPPENSMIRLLVGWRSWQRWGLTAGAGALVLAVFAGLLLRTLHWQHSGQVAATPEPPPVPTPVESPPAPKPSGHPQMQLRANDEVWLELRSPDNSLVFESTLKPGQQLSFPLVNGMRIRSGRPHRLDMALNEQPFTPLGAANDYSWRTLNIPGRSP